MSDLDIAIIGMSCRFPKAKDCETFWQLIRDGVELVTFFSDEEVLASGVDPQLLQDNHYVKAKAFLEDIEQFDAEFFNFSAREAEITDPQHRIFLLCAVEALEQAGYTSENYSGLIGVYAGVGAATYLLNYIYPNQQLLDTIGLYQLIINNEKDFLSTRVSYALNLKGPSLDVQTACSTSLVTTHLACQSLLNGECDMALAGGVGIRVPQKTGYLYQSGMIMSPDGHCRAFDAQAQGTVGGNGAGIVVLKRYGDAIKDKDTIYAVIKGSAINNDGSNKMGFTAPSVEGQTRVIAEAQAVAQVDADTIGYIETHGTGTLLGDPIEIKALTQSFHRTTDKKNFCAIGSVKTNMGHLDAAAGIAGLIKTVLSLKHKMIPPSLHFTTPNPHINFAQSPFYVNTQLSEWHPLDPKIPRRAGVSSFGVGGTNAHVVLEEAPTFVTNTASDGERYHVLPLSAKTPTALTKQAQQLHEYLQQHPEINLADVAYTLQMGRCAFEYRQAIVCQHIEQFTTLDVAHLSTHQTIKSIRERPVAFMFPGQGAQYVNMGRELYEHNRVFSETIDQCCEILRSLAESSNLVRESILDILYPNEISKEHATQLLKQTEVTQPALFIIEYALAQLWMSWGIKPQAMIGHSIGEYVAACIAGVFSLQDALATVTLRGRMMQDLPQIGAMLAVHLSEDDLVSYLLGKSLSLSAVNSSTQCVVSGEVDAIISFEEELKSRDIECQRLHTSHAFHSALVTPMLVPFTNWLKTIQLNPPKIPYISNLTGTWITAELATDPQYYAQHIRHTVFFAAGLDLLFQSPNVLLEVGPGQTLTRFALHHETKQATHVLLSSLPHVKDQQNEEQFILTTLSQLWMAGVQIDWTKLHQGKSYHRIALPTYPFEYRRYWLELPSKVNLVPKWQSSLPKATRTRKSDISDWFYLPVWQQAPQPIYYLTKQRWLIFIDQCGLGEQFSAYLRDTGHEVTIVRLGQQFTIYNEYYELNPNDNGAYSLLWEQIQSHLPERIVFLWTVDNQSRNTLTTVELAQQLGFYSLIRLAQSIGKLNVSSPITLTVVSNGIHTVIAEEQLYPEKATLLGAIKVIPQEYPQIRCQHIDVILPSSQLELTQLAVQLVQECDSNKSDLSVALRLGQRWIQSFSPTKLPAIASTLLSPTYDSTQLTTRLRIGGVYLITGGLGGMGLTLADYLVNTIPQVKLILIARSAFPNRKKWEMELNSPQLEENLRNKIIKLQQLEAKGAQLLIMQADVADETQMCDVINQAQAQFGQIHGVIHTAGVADYGGVIQRRDIDSLAKVLAAKVNGTLILDSLLGDNLDFFVLCSTLGSVLYRAKFGQVGYAAANEFLDAFAYYKKLTSSTFTTTINWTDWSEVGMSVDARHWWQQNYGKTKEMPTDSLNSAEGAQVFARVLQHQFPRVVVATQDLQSLIDEFVHYDPTQLIETESTLLPKTERYPRPKLEVAYIAPRNAMEQQIAEVWQDFLSLEQIGVHDDFFALGGDSLMAVQLVAKLRKVLKQNFSAHHLLATPTIAQLSTFLERSETKSLPNSLIQLRVGEVKQPCLFLIHPIGGHIFHYRDLVSQLDIKISIYGLQAQGLDGQVEPLTTIEAMATHYLKTLQTVQSEGEYLLGGASFGGIVAFEMAQQLKAAGKTVKLLFMLDTPGQGQLPRKYEHDWQILAYFLARGDSDTSYWLSKLENLNPDERVHYFLQQGKQLGILPQDVDFQELQYIVKVFRLNFQAMWNYMPQYYAGKLWFFRAKERDIHNPLHPELGWIDKAEMELYEVSGNHFTMNYLPHIVETTSKLKEIIAQ